MTVVCPTGHVSEMTDYCDVCGARMIEATAPESDAPFELDGEDTSPASRREPCPRCGAARSGDDRYCEACGYDFLQPAVPAWEAVATADRAQFERFSANGIDFPEPYAERRFVLEGAQLRVGRSRGSDDLRPDIDLAGVPEDPGISRLHAVLERQDDGSYAIRDLGSTNGTTLNDDPEPLGVDATTPLNPGDRIRIGAWTTITIRTR